MFDHIYYELGKKFYMGSILNYVVLDEKEYKRKLINGKIDSLQREIFESKCFYDKDFIRKVVDMHSLFYAVTPNYIKDDYEFLKELIEINPNIYKYCKFSDDKYIIKRILTLNPLLLSFTPKWVRDDEEYVLLTKNNKNEVAFGASERIKDKYKTYSAISYERNRIYL